MFHNIITRQRFVNKKKPENPLANSALNKVAHTYNSVHNLKAAWSMDIPKPKYDKSERFRIVLESFGGHISSEFTASVGSAVMQLFALDDIKTEMAAEEYINLIGNKIFTGFPLVSKNLIEAFEQCKKNNEDIYIISNLQNAIDSINDRLIIFHREIKTESVDINNILNIVTEKINKKYSDFRININDAGNWPPVEARIPSLANIFFNLINNSINAAKENKKPLQIDIKKERRDSWLDIYINDFSGGIPKDKVDNLFQLREGHIGYREIQEILKSFGIFQQKDSKAKIISTQGVGTTFVFSLKIS